MKRYILAFVIIVLYFGGLNSVRELTDLAIVKAVSIDKTDDGKSATLLSLYMLFSRLKHEKRYTMPPLLLYKT